MDAAWCGLERNFHNKCYSCYGRYGFRKYYGHGFQHLRYFCSKHACRVAQYSSRTARFYQWCCCALRWYDSAIHHCAGRRSYFLYMDIAVWMEWFFHHYFAVHHDEFNKRQHHGDRGECLRIGHCSNFGGSTHRHPRCAGRHHGQQQRVRQYHADIQHRSGAWRNVLHLDLAWRMEWNKQHAKHQRYNFGNERCRERVC